ncbi:hypothetical protein MTO96_013217 [Rhipicephalus appendiculatus]
MAQERRKKVRGQTRKQRLAIWAGEHVRAHVRRLFTRHEEAAASALPRFERGRKAHLLPRQRLYPFPARSVQKCAPSAVPRPFIAARDNKGHWEDRRRAAWNPRQTSRSIDSCVKKDRPSGRAYKGGKEARRVASKMESPRPRPAAATPVRARRTRRAIRRTVPMGSSYEGGARLARHRGRLTLDRTRASCTMALKRRHFSPPTNARKAAYAKARGQ